MSHGYLICPAISDQNGAEGSCNASKNFNQRVGFLPWAELGIPKLDSWAHLYRYSVTLAYAINDNTKKNSVTPPTTSDITIKTRNNTGKLFNLSNAIPAVLMSFGKNVAVGTSNDGILVANTSVSNIDEVANATDATGKTFINRDIGESSSTPGGEFDDLVIWLSPNVYLNRMVAVGQLP